MTYHNTLLTSYNPRLAWVRAFVYFAVCWLIGWATGSLPLVFQTTLFTVKHWESPWWLLFTIVCFCVILIGYGVIWPKGTLTHGRGLNITAVTLFGLSWGISEGLLFVSIWLLISRLMAADWLVTVLSLILLGSFKGLWHALYWDKHIAPEHNIPKWNLRKVLLVHVPNLIVTLTYLTLYENVAIFVLLQTTALVLSTFVMRFPPFWK